MKKLMQLEQLEAHASAVSMDALHVASAADCIVGSCGAGTATSTWWRTTRWTSPSGGGAVAPTEEEEQAAGAAAACVPGLGAAGHGGARGDALCVGGDRVVAGVNLDAVRGHSDEPCPGRDGGGVQHRRRQGEPRPRA